MGRLDVLVNNAGEQHPQARLEDISEEQWEKTFRTNIFGMFQLTKAALPLMGKGGAIINTTSITAYKGNPQLIDYSSTKGAITSFTRSLSMNLVNRGIRVNAVAPGPIWTPLIPSTFSAEKVAHFGADTPMGRPGQPEELAASYVYLACNDSSYVSGQVLHVNGGTVVNGWRPGGRVHSRAAAGSRGRPAPRSGAAGTAGDSRVAGERAPRWC